jgi:hypothetical protein
MRDDEDRAPHFAPADVSTYHSEQIRHIARSPLTKTNFDRLVSAVCAAALLSASCGTIFYPERRGQRGGRVDAGIAVLDALWLLLFIIPGVVAFVVDFSTGAIYLPGGRADAGPIKVVQTNRARPDIATIEAAVAKATGKRVRLFDPRMVTRELASSDELKTALASF